MKLWVIIFCLSFSSAYASYYATHCSNSKGDVKWETGHNSNLMMIKYATDEKEQEAKIEIHKLNIVFGTLMVIKNVEVQGCQNPSTTKVYAAKVEISPTNEFPRILDFNSTQKKIETEVICTYVSRPRPACPKKD
jgi:hypothetical protein